MEITENERFVLEIRHEIYDKIYDKIGDINDSKITAEYYMEEIERELNSIDAKLKVIKPTPQKIDVISPEYGPGDKVGHVITDSPIIFTVMEVRHNTQEYKLTSDNQIKPITIIVGWNEIDETL